MKTFIKISLAVLLLLLLMVTFVENQNVNAYKIKPYKISTPITFIPHENFSSTSVSHFNEALYQWNTQAGKTLMTRHVTSRHKGSSYPESDGISRIYRKGVGTGAGTYVAQATTRYNLVTKNVLESDINMNVSYPFANSAQPNKFDVWTVFLHEGGHSAGLEHSGVTTAVMYESVKRNHLNRSLSADDKAGINKIYK